MRVSGLENKSKRDETQIFNSRIEPREGLMLVRI